MTLKIAFLTTTLFLLGPSLASAQELVTECSKAYDGDPCTDGVLEGICGAEGPNNCEEGQDCYYPACQTRSCDGELQEGDACKLADLDGICTYQCDRMDCDPGQTGSLWCLIPPPSNATDSSEDGCSATGTTPGGILLSQMVLGFVGFRRRQR